MIRYRSIGLLLITVLCFMIAAILVSCAVDNKSEPQDFQQPDSNDDISVQEDMFTVTDLAGREITIKTPVGKIVAIGPGALRLVTYIDGLQRLAGIENMDKTLAVGRTYNMVFHEEFQQLPIIGQGGPDSVPDEEKLVEINPDVIFMASLLDAAKADELQNKAGIPVVTLSYGQAGIFEEDVYASLKLIGSVLCKQERASQVVDYIKGIQEDLMDRVKDIPDDEKPTVYVGALGFKGGHGIESTRGNYPPFMAVDARNVADSLGQTGSVMIDKEKLLEWDPDIIFLDKGNFSMVEEDYQKNSRFYSSLKAVKNNRVYGILPYNQYNTNIDTALANCYWVGKTLYPERFNDIDPADKAVEIYDQFFGSGGNAVYNTLQQEYGAFQEINFSD
jgi:iron complex transport system substrate-binding protein